MKWWLDDVRNSCARLLCSSSIFWVKNLVGFEAMAAEIRPADIAMLMPRGLGIHVLKKAGHPRLRSDTAQRAAKRFTFQNKHTGRPSGRVSHFHGAQKRFAVGM